MHDNPSQRLAGRSTDYRVTLRGAHYLHSSAANAFLSMQQDAIHVSYIQLQHIRDITMHWLKDYWWLLLVLLAGIILNGVKALQRLDHKPYLKNRPKAPAEHSNKAKEDQDDP